MGKKRWIWEFSFVWSGTWRHDGWSLTGDSSACLSAPTVLLGSFVLTTSEEVLVLVFIFCDASHFPWNIYVDTREGQRSALLPQKVLNSRLSAICFALPPPIMTNIRLDGAPFAFKLWVRLSNNSFLMSLITYVWQLEMDHDWPSPRCFFMSLLS